MAEKINKKFELRKILKDVVNKNITDSEELMKQEIDEEKTNLLLSYQETIKTKLMVIKNLENELLDLKITTEDMTNIISDGTDYEIHCKAKLNNLDKFLKKKDTTFTPTPQPRSKENIKLPPLEIRKFDGNATKWQTFYDSFNAAIDTSTSISKVEKFNYLQGFLEGDALKCISGLSLTENNYDQAKVILENRYGNKQLIISTHMSSLVKLAPVKTNDITSLRRLYDEIESHVRSLLTLGIDIKNYGSMLTTVILEKLPAEIKLILTRNFDEGLWDLKQILDLLDRELKARENCLASTSEKEELGKNDFPSFDNQYTGSSLHIGSSKQVGRGKSCVFCNGSHWSDKCKIVSDPKARKEFLKINKLCFICLKGDHTSQNCKKSKACFYCKCLHNSAICNKRQPKDKEDSSTNLVSNYSQILLQTVLLSLENPKTRKEVKIKALLDPGSQRTYVTDKVKRILNLEVETKEQMSINIFGDKNSKEEVLERVSLNIKSKQNRFPIDALSTKFICSPIKNQSSNFAKENFDHLKNLEFADSGSENEELNLLIGSDWYWTLATGEVRLGKAGEPAAIKTYFGWVLNGPVQNKTKGSSAVNLVSCSSAHTMLNLCSQNSRISEGFENNLNRFWDLETLGVKEIEKSNYENFTENSIYINQEGRYETKLPFKENHDFLYDNYDICEKRLLSLHEKLKKDPNLMEKYDKIFREQKEANVFEECSNTPLDGNFYYFPHHPVIKENRDTTKIRIVFDASAKTKGPSLNDCLYKGPQLTPLLFDILLRFRTYLIALTADIEKAFLQISINEEHRDFLRFLWFDDVFADEPTIVRNRFARVIFGVTSSSFLLNGVIRKHTETYSYDEEFMQQVLNSFYVDDFSGGANNLEKAYELFKKLKLRFLEGLFNLRKWRTNNPVLRQLIDPNCEINCLNSKILGISWNEFSDTFLFDLDEICQTAKSLAPTKRNILKVLSMFYDPIGVIQPIIVNLKLIFQEICRIKPKLNWDDLVPDELKVLWENSIEFMSKVGKIELPRKIIDFSSPMKCIELHGFSDASLKGYGACVYIRSVTENNEVSVNLVAAKSRVAPIKGGMTIPKLELMGNLVLSRLMQSVKNALEKIFQFSNVLYWTDSKVSLSWIRAQNKEFKTFVENRVQEIRNLTNYSNWFYCRSAENPADILTRTDVYTEFITENLWFEGPKFLSENSVFSDKNNDQEPILMNEQNLAETKTSVNISTVSSNFKISNCVKIENYSSMRQLYRITAWVKRFISNLIKRKNKQTIELSPFLTSVEIRNSEKAWIKENQSTFDKNQLNVLTKELNLITDENNIFRCKGRLQNAPVPYDLKTPILLNPKHRLAELIVIDIHRNLKHISVKHTLTELRERFWVCRGRQFVRSILRKCTVCRKYEGPSYAYPTSPPLTKLRLQDNYAFFTTGVDNFGPLWVKNIFDNDNTKLYKVWVTLYTCAASRGVLFDIVPFISAKAFIHSFRRFISRRGVPVHVISDNGTNFVSKETQNFVQNLGVNWDPNLPLAPWHGGFFERLVRNTKELLRKTLQKTKLNYEELQTILLEVENILNNRPLTYFYDDELESCLTPNHLLFGRRLERSNHDLTPLNSSVIQSSKLSHIINHFWERWRLEYLSTLREYHKHKHDKHNRPTIAIDDIVIIEEEYVPRSSWKTAKVIQLLEGSDNKVRGAVLMIPNSKNILKRPVNKLYKIESSCKNIVNDKKYLDNLEKKDIENVNNDKGQYSEISNEKDLKQIKSDSINTTKRPKRDAAQRAELKMKFQD